MVIISHKIGINSIAVQAAIKACHDAGEAFVYIGDDITIKFEPNNTNFGPVIDFSEMLENLSSEPIHRKKQPFWTQGNKKKGGRNKYGR